MNEILMAASVFVFFGGLVAFFRLFGKNGIFAWTVICTIAANIEVLILVHAYGMDTTLGNVIFASSFLIEASVEELSANFLPWYTRILVPNSSLKSSLNLPTVVRPETFITISPV